uniref:RUN domain-containing protein n=1 Tax=Macrostomum lignano TaxID=282301 RepID=A0A1I8JQE3_9PLAT
IASYFYLSLKEAGLVGRNKATSHTAEAEGGSRKAAAGDLAAQKLRSHVKLLKCLHDLINQRCAKKMDFLTPFKLCWTIKDTNERLISSVRRATFMFGESIGCLEKFKRRPKGVRQAALIPLAPSIKTANRDIESALNDQSEDTLGIRTDKPRHACSSWSARSSRSSAQTDEKLVECVERLLIQRPDICAPAQHPTYPFSLPPGGGEVASVHRVDYETAPRQYEYGPCVGGVTGNGPSGLPTAQ